MQHHVLLHDLTFKQFGQVDKFRLADHTPGPWCVIFAALDERIGLWVLKKSVPLSGIAGLNRAF
jgi:hypothetical protein